MNNRSKVLSKKDIEILSTWETKLQQLLLTMNSDKPFRFSVTLRCLGHIQNLKSSSTRSEFSHAHKSAKNDCIRLLEIKSSNQEVNTLLTEVKALAESLNNNIIAREQRNTQRRERAKQSPLANKTIENINPPVKQHKRDHATMFKSTDATSIDGTIEPRLKRIKK